MGEQSRIRTRVVRLVVSQSKPVGSLHEGGTRPGRDRSATRGDGGSWNEQQIDEVVGDKLIPALVAPDNGSRGTPRRWLNEKRPSWMRTVLSSEHGRARYAQRKQTVEPLYGDTKHNKRFICFHRRGRVKVGHRISATDDQPQPHKGLPTPAGGRGGMKHPPDARGTAHHAPATNGPPTSGASTRKAPRTFEK